MNSAERKAILADEILIVRNSGEIPEITYHGSLYYLQEDKDGPGLRLTDEEICALQEAALERYEEIVLRDLMPENRDKAIYRGLRRSVYNWQRMQDFCRRIGRDCSAFGPVVSRRLQAFLEQELADTRSGRRKTSVNCSVADLQGFCAALAMDLDELPAGWQNLFGPSEKMEKQCA